MRVKVIKKLDVNDHGSRENYSYIICTLYGLRVSESSDVRIRKYCIVLIFIFYEEYHKCIIYEISQSVLNNKK